MNFEHLQETMFTFLQNSPANYIDEHNSIRPSLVGMQIYDAPLLAVGAAEDPLFQQLKAPGVVGPNTFLPTDWLSDAKCVVSFFLPFTETVRLSNRTSSDTASEEWLHARIEGQIMLDKFGVFLCEQLHQEGFNAVYPAGDPRFQMNGPTSSNWSERHIAYVCGLGTFGLSKGLITKKGMAGRLGSIVTSALLPISTRPYSSPFEYCTMCGACQKHCPAQAIDVGRGIINGKDQAACAAFVQASKRPPHGPENKIRLGCGKCQVSVPCEDRIPIRNI